LVEWQGTKLQAKVFFFSAISLLAERKFSRFLILFFSFFLGDGNGSGLQRRRHDGSDNNIR
jgi:hypothetical protein